MSRTLLCSRAFKMFRMFKIHIYYINSFHKDMTDLNGGEITNELNSSAFKKHEDISGLNEDEIRNAWNSWKKITKICQVEMKEIWKAHHELFLKKVFLFKIVLSTNFQKLPFSYKNASNTFVFEYQLFFFLQIHSKFGQ